MGHVYDRWHKSRPGPEDVPCDCARGAKKLYPTAEHGQGSRWQARWRDGGHPRSVNFDYRADAERHIDQLGAAWCIVPKCDSSAATEPPVLLCADHRDLLLVQLGRKKPAVHEPLVYFIRNGARVKIGWTTNLKARLSALSLPAGAAALTVPGGPDVEKAMHARFAKFRVGRTEWFEGAPELEAFIAARTSSRGSVSRT